MSTPDRTQPSAAKNGRSAEDIARDFFPNFALVPAVLEAAQIGIWCLDIAAGKLTWSSNVESIHRLTQGAFDGSYATFENIIHSDDRPGVEASVKEAMRTLDAYQTRYRLAPCEGHEDCWLESRGTVGVKNGVPERLFGFCHDITERMNLEAELRSRIGHQQALAQLGERALIETELDRFLNDAVGTIAGTLAVDVVIVLELLPGNNELQLRASYGLRPDLAGTVVSSTEPGGYARYTLDSPLPVVTENFASETRFSVAPYLTEQGCVSGANVTIAGRDGRSYGILGVRTKAKRQFSAQETAFLSALADLLAGAIARRQLEQRHELMIRDMRHRSGNLFSQLLALFSQTAKNSKSIPDLTRKYTARVLTLANAHRLITEGGWKSIPIMDLLNVLLGPYLDRVSFSGPNIELEPDPVFNLSAALHELADNAIKHGSLSRPKGRLELSWSVERMQRGVTLTLDWVERNGPAARRPRRLGFGSRLVALVIERQLNGEVTRTFARKGLSVHMIVPLTHERWPTATPADSKGREAASAG